MPDGLSARGKATLSILPNANPEQGPGAFVITSMAASKKSTAVEGYREIPSELLERRPYGTPSLAARLAPYGFGAGVLAALGAALFFLLSSPVAGVDEEEPVAAGEVERLVERAKDRMNLTGSSQAAPEGESVVSITTVPVGAVVDIDFHRVGAAPLEYRTRPGVFMVSVHMPEHVSIDTVVIVEAGDVYEFSFALAPEHADTGSQALDGGPRVSIEAPTSREQRGEPTRSAGEATRDAGEPDRNPRTRTTAPSATAEIVISSHPTGAEAYLDGRRIGDTPVSIRSIATGDHRIRLQMEGYESYELDVHAGADETTSHHAELTRRTGTLEVLVRPWGSIYIDGVLHERSTDVKYVTRLPFGDHTVTAVHPNLGTSERTVRIDSEGVQGIVIDLP